MNRKLNITTTLFLIGTLICSSCLTTYADSFPKTKSLTKNETSINEYEMDNYGVEEDPYHRLTVSETNYAEPTLVSCYDPRNYSYLNDIRIQSPFSLCWSYATASMAELYVSKNYGRKFDVSDLHAAVAISNEINVNNIGTGHYTTEYNMGAFFPKVAQYYSLWNSSVFSSNNATWNSIVSEELFPKSLGISNNIPCDIDIQNTQFSNATSLFNITDVKYIDNDINTIKYFISNCGAVYTNFNYSGTYVSVDNNKDWAYNSNLIGSNHAVTIIGWDDNYPKENFNNICSPTSDGAWLIKNSWEPNNNYSGYLWISYEDSSILYQDYMNVILGVQKADDSEYMLSHDFYPLGCDRKDTTEDDPYVSTNSRIYMANVYDVSEYTNDYNHINKVMFYLKANNCTYNIRITQLQNNLLPTSIDNLPILATGSYSGEGYITETLDTNYYFNSNNKCAIILEIIPNNSSSHIYLPKETSYVTPARINNYESLYYIDNITSDIINWTDNTSDNENKINSDKTGNFCIRPILKKRTPATHSVTLDTTSIIDTTNDAQINITSDCTLFCVKTNNNILKQDEDYTYNNGVFTLKKEYLTTLGNTCTDIYFEFSNNITRIVTVNPQSEITNIEITGVPIIGDTLGCTITALPEKDEYDISYQWQSSTDGTIWQNIAGATNNTFTISNLLIGNYIRLVVTSNNFGNVVYPFSYTTDSTFCKVVLLGDADQNGRLSLTDATAIQKYLSNLITFNTEQLLAADYNRDGIVNVKDSTAIQIALVS